MIESFFLHYVLNLGPLAYLIAFVGMMIEGDALLFTAAFLTHQGYFDFRFMLPTLVAGVLFGDLGWYWLGHWMHHYSTSSLAHWIHRIAKPLDRHLLSRPRRTIFISKFTYGVHHAILIRAGALRLNIREFLKDDLYATSAWIALIGGLGYLSAASFVLIKHYVKFAEVALLLGLAAIFIISHIIVRAQNPNGRS